MTPPTLGQPGLCSAAAGRLGGPKLPGFLEAPSPRFHFDDSVTIMARIRLARIAFTKLQKAIFGTRRVALESKKIAYESLVPVLSLLLYGSECWVVNLNAENTA